MNVPIFDLHADLLSHLARSETHTPYDPESNASLPFLRAGGVKIQVLPMFTETNSDSVRLGVGQHNSLSKLLKDYSSEVKLWNMTLSLDPAKMEEVLYVIPAIENVSGFFGEDEDISIGFKRLDALIKDFGKLLYVGLTWNGENKYAGGVGSERGVSSLGMEIIEYLREREIAIDLSHASDASVKDILSYSPKLKILSSHSNSRALHPIPRNIPDETFKEVIKRGGLLGVNACRKLHAKNDISAWIENIEHLCELGGEDLVCFGVDFYAAGLIAGDSECAFLKGCEDASKIQGLVQGLRDAKFSESEIKKIAYQNVARYLTNL